MSQADWGFITPAFPEASRPLDSPDYMSFHAHRTNFLKAVSPDLQAAVHLVIIGGNRPMADIRNLLQKADIHSSIPQHKLYGTERASPHAADRAA
jgi:hypothetical protein